MGSVNNVAPYEKIAVFCKQPRIDTLPSGSLRYCTVKPPERAPQPEANGASPTAPTMCQVSIGTVTLLPGGPCGPCGPVGIAVTVSVSKLSPSRSRPLPAPNAIPLVTVPSGLITSDF